MRTPSHRVAALFLLWAVACAATIPPVVADARRVSFDEPPRPAHDRVTFEWTSKDGGTSGEMWTTLSDGESFAGTYRVVTASATSKELSVVYGQWHRAPWSGPGWKWGGGWPDYRSGDDFFVRYAGRVVATFEGDGDRRMRCYFDLRDGPRGIEGGGDGECQVSSGGRITAVIAPRVGTSDASVES